MAADTLYAGHFVVPTAHWPSTSDGKVYMYVHGYHAVL